MNKKTTIYLAGPMDNCSMDYQTTWRNEASAYLIQNNCTMLDPCRRPHDSDLTAREIYELDIKDVKNSDMILVDTRPIKRPSWGTAMEIMYAHEVCNIPVIGWCGDEEVGVRIFLDATLTRNFKTLPEALDHISAFYLNLH
jgi:nucleoside 2-deoxyribosyltransferase